VRNRICENECTFFLLWQRLRKRKPFSLFVCFRKTRSIKKTIRPHTMFKVLALFLIHAAAGENGLDSAPARALFRKLSGQPSLVEVEIEDATNDMMVGIDEPEVSVLAVFSTFYKTVCDMIWDKEGQLRSVGDMMWDKELGDYRLGFKIFVPFTSCALLLLKILW